MQLTGVTLRGNSAVYGGGAISNGTASLLRVTNSTLADNSAESDFYGAGGIDNDGTVTVSNCTLSGNSAGGVGDAIGNGGSATLMNTIISGPSESNCYNSTVPVTDGGHNLQWPGADCGATIPSLDPLLDPNGLKDNGGPTQTIALLSGSPAIDAGDPQVCANPPVNGVDQRGYARPGAGHTQCSIGAYEADAFSPEACVGDCDGTGGVTIDELITLVNIALGTAQPSACPHGVPNSADVDVALVIQAVGVALAGCPTGPPFPWEPGPFGVAVRQLALTKQSETHPSEERVLLSDVWYPAEHNAGPIDTRLGGVVDAACDGAGPGALTQDEAHQLVVRYELPFLLHHVAGDGRFDAHLNPAPGFRFTAVTGVD